MIGVIAKSDQAAAVEEFFQLFKTPWEFYQPGRTYDVVVVTSDDVPEVDARLLVIYGANLRTIDARIGVAARARRRGGSLTYRSSQLPVYGELLTFEERDAAILRVSTTAEAAGLRIHGANITVMRLGYDLFDEVCYLLSMSRLFQSWRAAASLPFVFVGWAKDFWEPFDWYLTVERNLPATYFVIPFKGRPGDKVAVPHPSRRAAAYDLADLAAGTTRLLREGCELAVHGIDAWHSVERGQEELKRVAGVNGKASIGIRMHWLLFDQKTFRVLEEAGFAYDSTVGYNETVGYRSGTTQVFRPL